MDLITYIPNDVALARENAAKLAKSAGDYAAYEPSVSDVLRQKINEAYSANQDITSKLDVATGNYLVSPQVAREKYQDIFNPFAREKLVAQYQNAEALPMLSLSNLLGNRLGRVDDLVGAGTRAFQAQTNAAQGAYDVANKDYTNKLSEFELLQRLIGQNEDQKLAREKFEFDKSQPSGSGTSATDKTNLKTASAWEDAISSATDKTGNVDPNVVWKFININQSALRASGVDVDSLWQWQKELASKTGTSTTTPADGETWYQKAAKFFGIYL